MRVQKSTLRTVWNRRHFHQPGFTLIEMLVVIAVIGILAAVTLGISGVASRTMRERRMEGELQALISRIENYRAELGSYPPDSLGQTSTNQLYYELSGCIFANGTFQTLSRDEQITTQTLQQTFNVSGVANSSRQADQVEYQPSEKFRESQVALLSDAPRVMVLSAPVRGPLQIGSGRLVNPWQYSAYEYAINNPRRFDLWADVIIGDRVVRFCNWGSGRIDLGDARTLQ